MREMSSPIPNFFLAMRDFLCYRSVEGGRCVMDFYSILQEILSEKDLSIPEAARACGLSDSTLRSIITRKNKTVALEVAMKISKGLCVSLERLNGMEELGRKNNAMHPDEEKLLKDFRSLNSEGKKYILQTMQMAVMTYKEMPETQKREA
jgi:plasmid maintenance system antidote protein VapI